MAEDNTQDMAMEDILSSIKNILEEDEAGRKAEAPSAISEAEPDALKEAEPDTDDILDLSSDMRVDAAEEPAAAEGEINLEQELDEVKTPELNEEGSFEIKDAEPDENVQGVRANVNLGWEDLESDPFDAGEKEDAEPSSKIEQQKQPSPAKTHTAQLSQNNKSTAAVTAADITLSKNKIPKINKRVKKAKTKKQLIYELEVQIAKYFWENVSFPNGYVTEFNFCLDDGNVADITVKSTPQNEYFNRKDVTTYRLYSDRKKAELGNNKVFSAKIYPFVCHKRTLRDYRTNRFKAVYAHNTPDGEFLIDLYNFIKNSGTNHYNKCSGSDYKVVNGIYKGNKLRVTVHDAVK